MLIDSDDLHITATVVRAMADASKKGWQALDSAASVLKEAWLGNRAFFLFLGDSVEDVVLLSERPNVVRHP
ncbi:hypothetical protein RBA17_19570, partial [Mycobacteroides abscessus subsp. massiliense]